MSGKMDVVHSPGSLQHCLCEMSAIRVETLKAQEKMRSARGAELVGRNQTFSASADTMSPRDMLPGWFMYIGNDATGHRDLMLLFAVDFGDVLRAGRQWPCIGVLLIPSTSYRFSRGLFLVSLAIFSTGLCSVKRLTCMEGSFIR